MNFFLAFLLNHNQKPYFVLLVLSMHSNHPVLGHELVRRLWKELGSIARQVERVTLAFRNSLIVSPFDKVDARLCNFSQKRLHIPYL